MTRLEKTVDDIRNDGRTILGRLPQPSPPPSPQPKPQDIVAGFYLTEPEASLIREFLRGPQRTTLPPKITLWSRLPDGELQPLPADLVGKLPKLKALRYMFDPNNNAIALIEPSGIVIAII